MALVFLLFVFWGLCSCSREQQEVLTLDRLVEVPESVAERSEEGVQAQDGADHDGGDLIQEGDSRSADDKTVIYVHVCGAVVSPGVVEVPQGSRAQAAVDAAGGFREDADTAFVNLAATVTDGEQLYIPTLEEAEALRASEEAARSCMVDLNSADVKQLCTLPGIGESRAGDIIAYRQENGGFTGIEDIMNVPGIKESTYNKIKDLITIK